jgi:hypothetical protein
MEAIESKGGVGNCLIPDTFSYVNGMLAYANLEGATSHMLQPCASTAKPFASGTKANSGQELGRPHT